MKTYSLIAIFSSLFAFELSADTIKYADGAVLEIVGNKATYTDPKGATTVCSIVLKKRLITCSGNSAISKEHEAMTFPNVNGRLQAGVRKMFRDAAP